MDASRAGPTLGASGSRRNTDANADADEAGGHLPRVPLADGSDRGGEAGGAAVALHGSPPAHPLAAPGLLQAAPRRVLALVPGNEDHTIWHDAEDGQQQRRRQQVAAHNDRAAYARTGEWDDTGSASASDSGGGGSDERLQSVDGGADGGISDEEGESLDEAGEMEVAGSDEVESAEEERSDEDQAEGEQTGGEEEGDEEDEGEEDEGEEEEGEEGEGEEETDGEWAERDLVLAGAMDALTSDEDEADQPGDEAGLPLLDRSVSAQHQYLGACDELQGGYGWLEEGQVLELPMLVLWGVVLFPGQKLPLRLDLQEQRHVLARALAAPPPARRLVFVAGAAAIEAEGGAHGYALVNRSTVGTTAEIRSVGRVQEDGAVAVVALGRQRAQIAEPRDGRLQRGFVPMGTRTARVRVLGEGCRQRPPPEVARHAAAWGPLEARAFDLPRLAAAVRRALALLLPQGLASRPPAGALELSYWAASNLPLEPGLRQALLDARDAAARLRMLVALLARADRVACAGCGTLVAAMRDLFNSAGDGSGGAFVNPHGHVHDMATFGRVAAGNVWLQGRPTTEWSWFEGYSWQICVCATCGEHLGWRFAWADPGRGRGGAEGAAERRRREAQGPGRWGHGARPREEGADAGGGHGPDEVGVASMQGSGGDGNGGSGRGGGDDAPDVTAGARAPSGDGSANPRRRLVFWGLRRPALVATDGHGLQLGLGGDEGEPPPGAVAS